MKKDFLKPVERKMFHIWLNSIVNVKDFVYARQATFEVTIRGKFFLHGQSVWSNGFVK